MFLWLWSWSWPIVSDSSCFVTEAKAVTEIKYNNTREECKLFFASLIDERWPKIAWLICDTIYREISANIRNILESILILEKSSCTGQCYLCCPENMIYSLRWYTPERKSRYDNISWSRYNKFTNMSSTNSMYLTIWPIFASELSNTIRIILYDDEFSVLRFIFYEILRHLPIASTELDDSIGTWYIRERYDAANEIWPRAESISDIRPECASPEFEIHKVQKKVPT